VFVTEGALERSLTSMLSEVVSKIARLLEHFAADQALLITDHALEEKLDSSSLWISYLDGLVPVIRNVFECS